MRSLIKGFHVYRFFLRVFFLCKVICSTDISTTFSKRYTAFCWQLNLLKEGVDCKWTSVHKWTEFGLIINDHLDKGKLNTQKRIKYMCSVWVLYIRLKFVNNLVIFQVWEKTTIKPRYETVLKFWLTFRSGPLKRSYCCDLVHHMQHVRYRRTPL